MNRPLAYCKAVHYPNGPIDTYNNKQIIINLSLCLVQDGIWKHLVEFYRR